MERPEHRQRGSLPLTFRATVNATGTYTNVAEVTASDQFDPDSQPDATPDSDPPTQDDEATATPMVNPVADLSLTKSITLVHGRGRQREHLAERHRDCSRSR